MADAHETSHVTPCISICDTVAFASEPQMLAGMLSETCAQAGMPGCARIYVGSYFCENFFMGIDERLHESIRLLCRDHDMGASLVIPIIGQARLAEAERRIEHVIGRFGDAYDEVIVNDVAQFHAIGALSPARRGIGRLFSKEVRDARYDELIQRQARISLSPEARECAESTRSGNAPCRPLIDVDPISAIVDASEVMRDFPDAEIAVHLPFCYATTGRFCTAASAHVPTMCKFRVGQPCSLECTRMAQTTLTDEGASYVKHGRTCFFPNPGCLIAGAGSWRLVYAAVHETMRLP